MCPENTACVTGHRPKDLSGYHACKEYNEIAVDMYKQVHYLYLNGYRYFVTGMAQGIDMLFAEAVLEFRKYHPEIFLVCYVPYAAQVPQWNNGLFGRTNYTKIITAARNANKDHVVVLYQNPRNHQEAAISLQKRNMDMVNVSSIVLAYYITGKTSGGTYNCIKYAKSMNRKIIYRNPKKLQLYEQDSIWKLSI